MFFDFKHLFLMVQRAFLIVALVIFYCLFFGCAFLFDVISNRFIFRKAGAYNETFWREPLGYEPDMDDCMRQS